MRLRTFGLWLPKNDGCGAICTADDTEGYVNAAIIQFGSITVPWLIALGTVCDPELISGHVRLDPEGHLSIAGRILHRVIMEAAKIGCFLLEFIDMKEIILPGLGWVRITQFPASGVLK